MPLWSQEEEEDEEDEGILLFVAIKYKKKELGKEVEYLKTVTNKQPCDVDHEVETINNMDDRLSDSGIGDEGERGLETSDDDFEIDLLSNEPDSLESQTDQTNELDIRGDLNDLDIKESKNEAKATEKFAESTVRGKSDEHQLEDDNLMDGEPNKDSIPPKEEQTLVKRVTWNETLEAMFGDKPPKDRVQHGRPRTSRGRTGRQGIKEIGRQRSMDSTTTPAIKTTTTSRGRSAAPVLRAWERSLRRNSPARRRLKTGVAGDGEREESGGKEKGGQDEGSGKEVDWEEDGEGVRKPVRRMRSKLQRPSSGRPLWINVTNGTSFNRFSKILIQTNLMMLLFARRLTNSFGISGERRVGRSQYYYFRSKPRPST